MEILKRYKEPNAKWETTTLKDTIKRTEDNGYWKKGTVENMLKENNIVFTPFVEYKKGQITCLQT